MTRPTAPLLIVLVVAASFAACAEASGEIRGHDQEIDTSPAPYLGCDPTEQIDAGTGTAWSDLYRDLFSPNGAAGCGNPACHGGAQGAGAELFKCFDEIACRDFVRPTQLRLPSDADDPENSAFVTILRHCDDDRNRIGRMPKQPASYFFSRKSIARVKAWIAAGAPD
jgi:hypothetical protein